MNKYVKTILALAAALAAAAAAAYVLYIYWEKIVAKISELKSLCPCGGNGVEEVEEPAEEVASEEETPAEAPVEETPAEEPATEEEPAVTEADFAD